MRRFIGRVAAAAAVLFSAGPAFGLIAAFQPPLQRAVSADVVVVGTVTAIEEQTVAAKPHPTAAKEVDYKIAVVKISDPLAGAAGLTHIKIGFVPRSAAGVPAAKVGNGNLQGGARPAIARVGGPAPEPKVGQESLFFLARHPTAGFYVFPAMSPPVNVATAEEKAEVAKVKAALAVLADPMKSLTAAKPEDRYLAAAALVTKYRSYPAAGGATAQVPVPAEESKLILQEILAADWKQFEPGLPNGQMLFGMLGVGAADGWKPNLKAKPGEDFTKMFKDEVAKWAAGPGKDYRIKRVELKK